MEASVRQFSLPRACARGDSAPSATSGTRRLGSLLVYRGRTYSPSFRPRSSLPTGPFAHDRTAPRRRPVDDTLIGASAPSSSEVCPLSLESRRPQTRVPPSDLFLSLGGPALPSAARRTGPEMATVVLDYKFHCVRARPGTSSTGCTTVAQGFHCDASTGARNT